MLARLAFLFVFVSLVELALLVRMGQWIGLWPTVGIVVLTGVVGATLARAEGLRTWMEFQRTAARGELPGKALLDGIAVLVGGALLLTPGLLTDALGFALLVPFTRGWIRRRGAAWLARRVGSGSARVRIWTGLGMWGPGPGEGDLGAGADATTEEAGGGDGGTAGLDPDKEIRQGGPHD